jgi:Phospholipase_D-nuclease N-terminal
MTGLRDPARLTRARPSASTRERTNEKGSRGMVGYDFPLLSLCWAFIVFFFVATVFFTVIWAFIDNFRRHDHSGGAKALWALIIIILPLLGTLIYLIGRPATVE